MRLLDRYLLRNFFEPFLICVIGFVAIWLIFDLSDNVPDFIEAKASFGQVMGYYVTQAPPVVLVSVPIGLLLALLFSLSRMSRSNEIISMLGAGQSVFRIIAPLTGVGVLSSVFCLWLNYELAPRADGGKKAALEQITKAGKNPEKRGWVEGYLFRDRRNNRTWYVRKLKPGEPGLQGVHITQQDAQGRITRKWYADLALYEQATKTWVLSDGMIVDFKEDGDVAKMESFEEDRRTIHGWTETPWRILSGHLEAQNLTVPELQDYLKFNSDFPEPQLAAYRTYLHYRWALPWGCLVVVFIAAPLGIVYSRRGVLAGVASSIFIFFAIMMLNNLFLALGTGDRIPAWLAAWFSNLFFGLVGLVLLYLRSTNRELPRLFAKSR